MISVENNNERKERKERKYNHVIEMHEEIENQPKSVTNNKISNFHKIKEETSHDFEPDNNVKNENIDEATSSNERIFDSTENIFIYKKVGQSPKFPTFKQIKKAYDHYFISSKPKTFHIKKKNITISNIHNEKDSEQNAAINDGNNIVDNVENVNNADTNINNNNVFIDEKRKLDMLAKKLSNNNKIFIVANEMKNALLNYALGYEKGIDDIINCIIASMRSNNSEIRAAYFGLALSRVFPLNDKYQDYFEKKFSELCPYANPYQNTIPQFEHHIVNIVRDAQKVSSPAGILFCYWCYINDTDKLFKWAETHNHDEQVPPNFTCGTAFRDLIYFAGKKLYETNPEETKMMAEKSLKYLNNYKNEDFNDWSKVYGNTYKQFPSFYERFIKNLIPENKESYPDNPLSRFFEKYRNLAHLNDQEEVKT